MGELKRLIEYYKKETKQENLKFIGLSLSSRKNLCIHPEASKQRTNKEIDAKCMGMTASFVREKAKKDKTVKLCNFFEGFELDKQEKLIPYGVYNLDDLNGSF